jgi:hypothetical protein
MLDRSITCTIIDLPSALAELRKTSFFISPEILDTALERDRRRREK